MKKREKNLSIIDFCKKYIDEFLEESKSAEIMAERLFIMGSITRSAKRFFEFFGIDASDISGDEFALMDKVLRRLWDDDYNRRYMYMFGRYGTFEIGGDES